MRIVILSLILLALLLPGLRAEATALPRASLHPTGVRPGARGEVGYAARAGRVTLQLTVAGLAAPSAATPAYVVWVADGEGRLINSGTLTPNLAGEATATLGPLPVAPAGLIVAVSAEPNAAVVAPTDPRKSIILSGQFPQETVSPLGRLSTFLGPDWFAPILPAALGLTLLRQARRAQRARGAPPPPSPAAVGARGGAPSPFVATNGEGEALP